MATANRGEEGKDKDEYGKLEQPFGWDSGKIGHVRHNIRTLQKIVSSIMKWQEYIVSDPLVLLGKPIIKGTRISVELLLELFSTGWSEEQILDSYPSVTDEALRAVFWYLKECIQQERYFTISA